MSQRITNDEREEHTREPKGKLTAASLTRLHEIRRQILGSRRIVTYSTETLRKFRDGEPEQIARSTHPEPPRSE